MLNERNVGLAKSTHYGAPLSELVAVEAYLNNILAKFELEQLALWEDLEELCGKSLES